MNRKAGRQEEKTKDLLVFPSSCEFFRANRYTTHKRQRYQTALGSAREVLACVDVAKAMRYVVDVDAAILDRMDHVIATLTRLVYRRA